MTGTEWQNGLFPHGIGLSLLSFPCIHFLLMPTEPENAGETLADVAIDWLVLMRSGSVSAKTRRDFDRWLQQDRAHRKAYADAEALWDGAVRALKSSHTIHVPSRLNPAARPAKSVRRGLWNRGLAVATSLVLGLFIAWNPVSDWLMSDYSTQAGEQKRVVLADASSVLLNTESAIALDWSADRRRIVLQKGQAEFRVARDAGRPFDVEAGNTSVLALGTVFEVFEQTSGEVDVSVSEHAVAVSLPGALESQPMRVEEGWQLHYDGHGKLGKPASANLHRINVWKRGKLIFRDQSLAAVVAELNRYSKARILLQGNEIAQLRVSGVFPIDATEVLDALEKSFSLRATHLGSWLVILRAGA
ncbi:MAG: FecR family protein [Methylococcales bacterium]